MGDSSRSPGRRRGSTLRRRAFFSLMAGFLLLPVMPFQFTSILTAIVWSVSGVVPGMVFLVLGTFFRMDSWSIMSGLQGIVRDLAPGSSTLLDQSVALGTMFVGNLASAFLFRLVVRRSLMQRIPRSVRVQVGLPVARPARSWLFRARPARGTLPCASLPRRRCP